MPIQISEVVVRAVLNNNPAPVAPPQRERNSEAMVQQIVEEVLKKLNNKKER